MSPKIDTLKILDKLLDREAIKHVDDQFNTNLLELSAPVICPVTDVIEIVTEDLLDFIEDTIVTLHTDQWSRDIRYTNPTCPLLPQNIELLNF